MAKDLQCVRAHPVRVNGETVVRRCRGSLIPSTEGEGYLCSDEGEEVVYSAEVVRAYEDAPLWHRVSAVSHMLGKLTRFNPRAENSTYPWIDLPLNETDKVVVETSGGWWMVHVHRSGHASNSYPVDIQTSTDDTEATAHKIAQIVALI